MARFWMPPQTPPLPNDLGIFLMQCPKNSLISAWPLPLPFIVLNRVMRTLYCLVLFCASELLGTQG